MKYTCSRNKLTGKLSVHYECPECDSDLTSALTEAGQQDTCPECETPFTVPGTRELQQQRAEKARAEREKKEAERQKKEQKLQQQTEATRQRDEQIKQAARWKSTANQLQVSTGDLGRPFDSLGIVFGYSSSVDSNQVHQSALEDLKSNAAQLSADGLMFVHFQDRTTTKSLLFGLIKQQVFEVFAWGTAVKFPAL